MIQILFVIPSRLMWQLLQKLINYLKNRRCSIIDVQTASNDLSEDFDSIMYMDPSIDEYLSFMEIFNIDENTVLGINRIERCPDETAIIRIVCQDTFSKPYKRKVYYEKNYSKDRYIKVDGKKYYINS